MEARRALGWQLAVLAVVGAVATTAAAVAVLASGGATPVVTSSRAATDRDCPASPAADQTVWHGGVRARQVGAADEPSALALVPLAGADAGEGVAAAAGRDGVLAERPGRLLRVEAGALTEEVLLDLTDDTANEGDGGLLAVAYDPEGAWLYVYRTTRRLDDVLTAYPVDATGRPDPDAGREVLLVERKPSLQHHGGSMAFGPDGMLYLGLGDGGGLGDPQENAQDPSSLLGKILRIDPTPDDAAPYVVPSDNPMVDRHGWRPEIWALGVRNPFRVSFDPAGGDLWLGDVGQSCWEEIDRIAPEDAGANLGWDRFEGDDAFEGGELPGGHHRPVLTRPHSAGWCAIVAGYVVRDGALAGLEGWLLVTDYCAGRLLALHADGVAEGAADAEVRDLGVSIEAPVAVVPGPNGRPWVLSLDGPVLELVG